MMRLHFETERLYLVSFNKEYLDKLLKKNLTNYYYWFGDKEITKYNSHGVFPKSEEELDSFFRLCDDSKDLLVFAILDKETERHIGMVSLQRIDHINSNAEFAIIIGETDYWGKGIATEALLILLTHGFLKLGLNRIWSGTSVLNKGMIRCFEKVGMVKEGIFREAQLIDGRYKDIVLYSILKEDYKMLYPLEGYNNRAEWAVRKSELSQEWEKKEQNYPKIG